ncbi:hypothetical protein SEA_LUNA18_28 [Microbacterium phage Luna18]|nr:hypothetical protein SEA_CHEPLI_28 [Microbacterium phage Chepli]QZE10316.1 hypothetical protein SEA_KATCHAN_28 [Microbacterium phage KatChan]URQ04879.1 hypothetical protein SEA_LUNA18_28 [Microbacterium phage Luna18]
MAQAPKQVKVENLNHNDVIVDPEGNTARVIRVRRIDHQRAKLETDIGDRVVALADKFPVLP